ncbi:MAG: hypothetical protein ABIJ23_04330 [Candidatus Magasanikbacteria bacterium]
MTTKKDIFKSHLAEWLAIRGDREKRGKMAEEISRIAKIHVKSVSRSFKRVQLKSETGQEYRGRPMVYTKDVDSALFDVWETAYRPCGELLHPSIKTYVIAHQQLNRWHHSPEATKKLLSISLATVKRKTKVFRQKYGTFHGRSTTNPSSLKSIIPIFKGPWNDLKPGNGQLDTVAHCGDSVAGDFVYTVSFVDSPTYWGVRRAQWNKGQMATKDNLVAIKRLLPFSWIMAHPDTGSEFINWIAKDWCDEQGILLTRSEPGKKNDNMYVEERNGHVVRKFLGWQRLDAGAGIVSIMNDYYETLDLYLNHFQAVRRTVSKTKVGSKYKREFEKVAQTPYQRLMDNIDISGTMKARVEKEHQDLNPLLLKDKLDILQKKIFKFQKNNNQRTERT